MAVELAHAKIKCGTELVQRLSELNPQVVNGVPKLRKRIQAEIKTLKKKLEDKSELKEEFIQCSNLGQLEALVGVATEISDVVTAVLKPFSFGGLERIVVDVVADEGRRWIKVILRNPKALHLTFITRGRKSIRPLDEIAEDFLMCAEQNLVFYSPPKIEFWFCGGVSEGLANCLEEMDVLVKGSRIPDSELGLPDYSLPDSDTESEDCISEDFSEECETDDKCDRLAPNFMACTMPYVDSIDNDKSSPSQDICGQEEQNIRESKEEVKAINLDVTAMIAYVSATSNGGAEFQFLDKFLTEQAEWERRNPVKKVLNEYFEGRVIMACQEAVDHFLEIISIIGGEGEKFRAKELVSRLHVVPGQDVFEETIKLNGKVRHLARIIFGTSEAHRAITVTSNRHFVRSAENKGIHPVVFYHEPRALTEQKQETAVPI